MTEEHLFAMGEKKYNNTRLCYLYIYNYLSLHDVGIVVDPHFKYQLDLNERKLTISRDYSLDDNFWGKHVYSETAIVGDNGSGKTTALRQIMEATVDGTDKRNLDAVIVLYDGEKFLVSQPSNRNKVTVEASNVAIDYVNDPFELSIETFYFSGHVTFYNHLNNLISSELSGLYNACDGWRLIKDYEEYENEGSARSLSDPILYYFNAFNAQSDDRICALLANCHIRDNFREINLPRYIYINPNNSGIYVIRKNKNNKFKDFANWSYKSPYRNSKERALSLFVISNIVNLLVQYSPNAVNAVFSSILNEWQRYESSKGDNKVLDNLYAFIATDKVPIGYKDLIHNVYEVLNRVDDIFVFDEATGFFYIDVRNDNGALFELRNNILASRFYLTAHFFDIHYSHVLGLETTLSSGEQVFLHLFSNLYRAIEELPKQFDNKNIPTLLILDEAEVGFHPEWQRLYVSVLTSFLNSLVLPDGLMFQVIITTHSPILLSDFPLQSTNFLKRNEHSDVMNLRDKHLPTFGSNVFELYRDSFFLENGMIGEFASNKIANLRKEINNATNVDENEYSNWRRKIDLVGDAFIRNGLCTLLDDKMSNSALAYYQHKVEELQRKAHHE